MITDAQFKAWLVDPSAIRIVLMEAGVNSGGTELTRYLSTGLFVTGASETPANTAYSAIATKSSLQTTESLSLTGATSLTASEVEVYNLSGERDSWLNDVWTNRPFKAWVGDPRWARADFRMIFNGVTADVGSKSRDKINLILRDKMQLLNTPMTDITLGGDNYAYAQVGTTVTVTKPAHGRNIGSPVQILITTGGATSNTYMVTGTPSVDTFTYTAPNSLTTSGYLTLAGLNAGSTIPLTFGEVHNISPLLVDSALLQYQTHNGPVESIFEVRDNGVPIAVTMHDSTGKFELNVAPAGVITVSMQGDKTGTYKNDIASLVQRIVTGFGKVTGPFAAAPPFTTADLDLTNLAAFTAAHPQPVGLFVSARTNVISACQQLASSIGAQIVMSRLGLLQLFQLSLPATGAATPITQSMQVDRTLTVVSRTPVVAAVKLGYCQNWTVQNNLLTSIPAEDKVLYSQQWLSITPVDTSTQVTYKLNAAPVQQDTCLLTLVDAKAEASRRLTMYKVPRTLYQFEGTPECLLLTLGQTVTLFSSRYSLSAGQTGVVTSLVTDWSNCHVTVQVLI